MTWLFDEITVLVIAFICMIGDGNSCQAPDNQNKAKRFNMSMMMNEIERIEESLTRNSIDTHRLNALCKRLIDRLRKSPYSFTSAIEEVRANVFTLQQTLIPDRFTCNQHLKMAIESFILEHVHDVITAHIYRECAYEDNRITYQCRCLKNTKLAHTYEDIEFSAAIVELASLDGRRNVQSKISCLASCFDLIYADLKLAMIELIAEGSDSAIPVVDNAEVGPILCQVILKAQCAHLYSNLLYIQSLSTSPLSEAFVHILQCFNAAIDCLLAIDPNSNAIRKTRSEMDLHDILQMNLLLEDQSSDVAFKRLSMQRLSKQISKSHQFVANKE